MEFLHPYETLGIDANAITAKYAGEMFLNYCLSSATIFFFALLLLLLLLFSGGGEKTRGRRRRF